jgi:hypothetical protein
MTGLRLYLKGRMAETYRPVMIGHCKATAAWGYVEAVPRKASRLLRRSPVPQTDTGIRDEYSKARELTLSKELGKLAPYLR